MEQTRGNDFLGVQPIGKLLLKLSLPTVAAQLINMLYNIVDRIYIGHMPGNGALALTGVGICMPIILIVSAFAALVAMGGAPRASIFMGRGDRDAAEESMGGCFALQILLSLVLTAALLLWNRDFLLAFGASENTVGYGESYMNIYALGTLFVQLSLGMNAYITAQGFTLVSMRTVLVGAALNIVLDPLFIFVLNMGVEGAALATVLSQGVTAALVVRFLLSGRSLLRLRLRHMRIRSKVILPCLALGLAPFIMQSSESVISVCFNSSLLRYGGDLAVGAMTILTSVMQFAMMPLQGLAQGAQPITSYNYGAGNGERVKQTFFLLLKLSLGYSILLWAAIMLFPGSFAAIFTSDQELIRFAGGALRVYCGVLCIFGAQIACQMTFISLGNAKASIMVAIVRKFALLLPLIYLMPAVFGRTPMAVYAAEPAADILAVSFTACLFAVQFKKALEAVKTPDIREKRG